MEEETWICDRDTCHLVTADPGKPTMGPKLKVAAMLLWPVSLLFFGLIGLGIYLGACIQSWNRIRCPACRRGRMYNIRTSPRGQALARRAGL